MDVVEYNASDTRSKKSISSVVKAASACLSVSEMIKPGFQTLPKSALVLPLAVYSFEILGQSNKAAKQKKVLIMDEVDGMAGNEVILSTYDVIKDLLGPWRYC